MHTLSTTLNSFKKLCESASYCTVRQLLLTFLQVIFLLLRYCTKVLKIGPYRAVWPVCTGLSRDWYTDLQQSRAEEEKRRRRTRRKRRRRRKKAIAHPRYSFHRSCVASLLARYSRDALAPYASISYCSSDVARSQEHRRQISGELILLLYCSCVLYWVHGIGLKF